MMKELDPLLHSQLRLAIVSLLIGLVEADFFYLRQQTGATAGNLSVQIDKLQKGGYIQVKKTFEGRKPKTICRMTTEGIKAFENYVEALKTYLNPTHKI